MESESLISVSSKGLYCRRGDFYIDPWQPVDCAVLTHGHSDHARIGSRLYHITDSSLAIIQRRLGLDGTYQTHAYNEPFVRNGVQVSFHPAGHILGSAQIRVATDDEVWVVSGDYKRDPDPTCEPFEVVPCDVLITEATFGLPVFRWQSIEEEADNIYRWWQRNKAKGKHSLLGCYALGKAQRVLHALGKISDEPVMVHGAVAAVTDIYRERSIEMIPTVYAPDTRRIDPGQLVLAPPAALSSNWARKFGAFESGFASGWMRIRGNKRRRGYDRGFVISDHADWPALLQTVAESRARKVYVTHGYAEELAQYLRHEGVDAAALSTLFEGESDS